MKKQLLALNLLLFAGIHFTQAQVGVGTTSPDASATMELSSTERGFLAPRMTKAQMDAISSPATGLHVFIIPENKPCWQVNTPANPYWNCDGGIVLRDPTDLPATDQPIGANITIIDETDGSVICTGVVPATGTVTTCDDIHVPVCPTTDNTTITGVPVGPNCGGSVIALSSANTDGDSYLWVADNGATFDNDTIATPNLTLPNVNTTVTVGLTVTKAGCTPSTASPSPVSISVVSGSSINISGENCLDVEATDYDPVNDPLADRISSPDDFTDLIYTVGPSTGGTSFTWSWVSNLDNHAAIQSGTNNDTVIVTFDKNLAAAGGVGGGSETYILQCEIGGLTCGTMTRTYHIIVQDKSCYCPTAVVEVTSPITGRTWMDRNLGAVQAATSQTDYLSYGCMFEWGRKNDGHAEMNWTSGTSGTLVNTVISTKATTNNPGHQDFIGRPFAEVPNRWTTAPHDSTLWIGASAVNTPCPSGFRLPTIYEIQDEFASFPSSGDRAEDAFDSFLKLPSAGLMYSNAGHAASFTGSRVLIWSSSQTAGTNLHFRHAHILPSSTSINAYGNTNGIPVRCIKD